MSTGEKVQEVERSRRIFRQKIIFQILPGMYLLLEPG